MCSGDDHSCPQFQLHRKKLLDDLDGERRSFLKSAFVAGGGAAAWAASGTLASPASAQTRAGQPTPLPAGDRVALDDTLGVVTGVVRHGSRCAGRPFDRSGEPQYSSRTFAFRSGRISA